MAESIPEVLALPLPEEPGGIPIFSIRSGHSIMSLVTEEDRNRSAHYKTALEFGRELKQASSLESFVKRWSFAFNPAHAHQASLTAWRS